MSTSQTRLTPAQPTQASNRLYDVPLLKNDGSNFQMWKHRTELVLLSRGLMQIVNGTEKEPAATDQDAVTDWKTRELDAQAQI
jgi:hypothetical protein